MRQCACQKLYREGDWSAQPCWQVSCVDVQAEMQATPADAFRFAGAFAAGLGSATAGTGTTHVVLQFDAWELHDIMQLVVVDVSGVESPGVVGAIFGVCACAAPLT